MFYDRLISTPFALIAFGDVVMFDSFHVAIPIKRIESRIFVLCELYNIVVYDVTLYIFSLIIVVVHNVLQIGDAHIYFPYALPFTRRHSLYDWSVIFNHIRRYLHINWRTQNRSKSAGRYSFVLVLAI